MQLLEEHEHLERRTGVEVTGSLVGQQHGGIVDQRTGDGHTLHLSARHLVRLMFQTVAQAHGLQSLDGSLAALLGVIFRIVHQRQFDVLHSGGLRQQVIVLEDEAYLLIPEVGALRLRHRTDGNAVEEILARGWGVETAELVEQCRLAATRRALDGDKLALVNLERHTAQRLHRLGAYLEVALHVLQFDDYFLVHILFYLFTTNSTNYTNYPAGQAIRLIRIIRSITSSAVAGCRSAGGCSLAAA